MNRLVEQTQKLVDYIESHTTEDLDITRVAKDFGISPWYLQHTFKALVGDTLGGYIRGRRLQHSVKLLRETDYTLLDIAVQIGFASHEAFTRAFQKQFGMAPSAYRKTKPKILIQAKPVLSEELLQHMQTELTTEPRIYVRDACKIVGYETKLPSPFIEFDRSCANMNPAWMRLFEVEANIPHKIPGSYAGAIISESGTFTEEHVSHIASVVVDQAFQPEQGLVYHEFPQQLVAEFSVASLDSMALSRTLNYVYGIWLPNSPYTRADGSDYEFFEGVTDFAAPGVGSKYIVPLREKA